MIAIEFQFLTGKYHATPWDRNVNEGEVEWPISTFRLSRGIIDVWKRRFPELASSRIERILGALSEPPYFHLPPAATSHTRSFLSSNKQDPTAKQKIFDAFVVVEPSAPLYALFQADLDAEDRSILALLLNHINYLGRSESWIDAKLLDVVPDVTWNCRPLWTNSTHLGAYETVSVACLASPVSYHALAAKPQCRSWQTAESGESICSWLESLCLSTSDLLSDGWSAPPAMAWVHYARPVDAFEVRPMRTSKKPREIRYVKYAIHSNVLPRIEETIYVAERTRAALMSCHKKIENGDPRRVSPVFSGKRKDGQPLIGHSHAFYLPVDEDGDGRIDHVIVHAQTPFTPTEIQALDSLHNVWQPGGKEPLRFILTSTSNEFRPTASKTWVSITPFVTARHYKRNCGSYEEWLRSEVVKECLYNDLPEPRMVTIIPNTINTVRSKHWWAFNRSRKGGIPLAGYGFVLEFKEPVKGLFSLGALGHFGLGLFTPYSKDTGLG